MTVDYNAAKGAGRLIPAGATPDFAGDVNELIQWLQKGRTYRRFANMAAMPGAGVETLDLAMVDNIPGAWWKYDGTTAAWKMYGTAEFPTASARATAITAPALGMMSKVATEPFERRYNGTTWKAWGSNFPVIPTSIVGAGATLGTDGAIACVGVTTLSLNGINTSDFDTIKLRAKGAMAVGVTTVGWRLRNAGVDIATALYDNQYGKDESAARSVSAGSGQTTMVVDAFTGAFRIAFSLEIEDAYPADQTSFIFRENAQLITSGAPRTVDVSGWHRDPVSADGLTLLWAGTGGFTGDIRITATANN